MRSLMLSSLLIGMLLPGCAGKKLDRVPAWRADISHLASNLPAKHPDLFCQLPREEFEGAIAALDRDVSSLTDAEIVVRLAQVVAMAGDSHTAVNVAHGGDVHYFPLGLYWFDDGVRVIAAEGPMAHLIGGRLIAIDECPADEAIEQVTSLVAAENDAILKDRVPQMLVLSHVLHTLGITEALDAASFTFESESGERVTERIGTLKLGKRPAFRTFADRPGYEAPLSLRSRRDAYWMEYLEESKTLYIQYNKCKNKALAPFSGFYKNALKVAKKHGAERMVIDLRHNGGGNSSIADPFIAELKAHETFGQRGRLFVIIGRKTFSSALINAVNLREKCGAILVGESTGGAPNHFGEVRMFTLPNNGLTVQHSTKRFTMHAGEEANTLLPDIPAAPTWEAWAQGRDDALAACLAAELP